jgi:hypothetical protein
VKTQKFATLILHVVVLDHISHYADHAIVLRFLAGEKDTSLLQVSTTALEVTQLPVQWVPEDLSLAGKAAKT